MKPCTFHPQPSKFFFKITRSEKVSYIFSKESFSYISENGTLHFSFNPSPKNKRKTMLRKFLMFHEMETPKNLLIFFSKEAILMFQETFYISGSNFPCSKMKHFIYLSC